MSSGRCHSSLHSVGPCTSGKYGGKQGFSTSTDRHGVHRIQNGMSVGTLLPRMPPLFVALFRSPDIFISPIRKKASMLCFEATSLDVVPFSTSLCFFHERDSIPAKGFLQCCQAPFWFTAHHSAQRQHRDVTSISQACEMDCIPPQ